MVSFGIDANLQRFQKLSGEHKELGSGDDWVRVVSLSRDSAITAQPTIKLKADLMKFSWRPDYFKPKLK